MQTREMHPFLKTLFILIKDEKLQPAERVQKIAETLEIIQDSRQRDLASYERLRKISPNATSQNQEAEIRALYSLDVTEGNQSLLNMALEKKMTPIVQLLLKHGASPAFVNPENGAPPLNAATHSGNVDSVVLLLEAKADPNKINLKTGNTPLIIAARDGHVEMVKILLKAGANTNYVNSNDLETTPILYAIQNAHNDIMKLLLKAGSSLHLKNIEQLSVLHCAASVGNVEAAKILLNAKVEVEPLTKKGITPLLCAVFRHHNVEMIQLLVEAKANPNFIHASGETLLHTAARLKQIDNLKALLQAGANPNHVNPVTGETVLFTITNETEGYTDIVRTLLDAHADLKFQHKQTKRTPLINAAFANNIENVNLLLERKAEPDSIESIHHYNALLCACQDGYSQVAIALLNKNADSNFVNTKYGTTPLIWAAQEGFTDIVIALIEKKADPNLANKINFHTPLLQALRKKRWETVAKLIELGAQVDKRRADDNLTLLEYMIEFKALYAIPHLLNHHATVFEPLKLYNYLMAADQRDPDVLESLRFFCEQQKHMREFRRKADVDPALLLPDDTYAAANAYLAKLTELTQIYKKEIKSEIEQAIQLQQRIEVSQERKNTSSTEVNDATSSTEANDTRLENIPGVLNIITSYSIPLEHLSMFKPRQIDEILSEAKSKQKQTPK